MALLDSLEAGRLDFREATQSVPTAHASVKPSPESWSVLDCVEHVVTVERRFLGWIAEGRSIPPLRDTDKELRLFTMVRSRLSKREAPEPVRPSGRFKELAEAMSEFEKVRDRTMQVLLERGDGLYSIGAKHGFFGEINAVELINLIDGHARRHAEQIREICEALESAAPKRRAKASVKTSDAFKRDRPDLPSHFEPFADDWSTLESQAVRDVASPSLKLDALRIDSSLLERVQLAESRLGSIVIKDSRLVGCDLANIRAGRITMLRVELIDCRLTGLHATALEWQDVLIERSDLRYAQLQGGKFKACEFDECNLEEAGLQESDLSGSVIRNSKLREADLRGAVLHNADFRKSEIEGHAGEHD